MSLLEPKRELGFLQTTSVIIGAVIGSGVFINIPIVAKFAGTPLMSVLIWALGGILWIPQILILAEMGTAYPNQGGPYFFLYKAGSPFFAFLYTWTAFLTSDTPTLTIIGLSAASALKFFFPHLGDPLYARFFAAAMILGLAALQVRSVKTGGNLQIFLTTAKLLPLMAIMIIGFFYLGSGNLISENTSAANGGQSLITLTAGISATLWAYAGFLNILYMAGEVKNPATILPRSLIFSLFLVLGSYVLISFSTGAIVPFHAIVATEGEFMNPFTYLSFFADYAGGFFAVAAFVSMIGVLNSTMMTQPRLEFAMARDGLFFPVFGKLHSKFLTPHYSIIIQAALAIGLFLLGDVENMLGYFTLSYVLQNGLVYGAIFFLRKKEDYRPTYRAYRWRAMALIAITIQLYLAWGTFLAYPTAGVLASLGLILTGLPIYLYFHKYLRRE